MTTWTWEDDILLREYIAASEVSPDVPAPEAAAQPVKREHRRLDWALVAAVSVAGGVVIWLTR